MTTESEQLDLSPRAPLPSRPARRGAKRWISIGVLIAVVAAGGVIVTRFLTDAIDYFCTLDELGERDGCMEGARIRVLGTVEEGSVEQVDGNRTNFTIVDGERRLAVRFRGVPAGMFAECEPVVVHGILAADGAFDGDSLDVKHDNEYAEANPDRVDDGTAPNCAT